MQRRIVTKNYFPQTKFCDIISDKCKEDHKHRKIVSVKDTASAMDAFSHMTERKVSGLAVVDDNGVLVSVLSASDFMRMKRDVILHDWDHFFDDLREPIKNYLNLRNFYFPGTFSKAPMTIDMKNDTVMDVLNKVITAHIHRLFVIDEKGVPTDVWSLSDIIKVFLTYEGVKK